MPSAVCAIIKPTALDGNRESQAFKALSEKIFMLRSQSPSEGIADQCIGLSAAIGVQDVENH